MKKLFYLVVIMLMMSLAAQSVYAQNENLSVEQTDEIVASTDPGSDDSATSDASADGNVTADETAESPASAPEQQVLNMNDLATVVALLNNTTDNKKQNIMSSEGKMFVPLSKKGKFSGHHICQRLELSVLGGKDKSEMDLALSEMGLDNAQKEGAEKAGSNQGFADDMESKVSGLNVGANFGYSVVFVPGYQENDQLLLNRFGFAYSVGLIFQFDNEKKAGVTCDFLGKIGVETGFNKKIGVGVDFLFGGGKTAQAIIDFTDVNFEEPDVDDLVITQENLWCAKAGTQLWLRLNFLTKSNNFDTALFTRFVYSFRPYSDEEFAKRVVTYDEIPFWQHESWSFGFTMTYFF